MGVYPKQTVMCETMSSYTPGFCRLEFILQELLFRHVFFLQNINLQNLKRASAFIDIQDRYKESICTLPRGEYGLCNKQDTARDV